MTAEPAVPRDPRRVELFDADQTRYWMRELGASAEVLREAVERAGSDVEQVRGYLSSGS